MSNVLKKGARGDEVSQLQQGLKQLGFNIQADGIFGDATHNAVIALQTIFGYDIDGMVGPATLKLLQQQTQLGWNLQRARNNGYGGNTQASA